MRRRVLVFALLYFLPLLVSATCWLSAAMLQTLAIASKSCVHAFAVELALTPEQQSRGLMYRLSLPEGQGMLFDFKRAQETSFWMKNTYVPLDMIFSRSDGRIQR